MVAIITGRGPGYPQSSHRARTAASAPSVCVCVCVCVCVPDTIDEGDPLRCGQEGMPSFVPLCSPLRFAAAVRV